MTIAGTVVGPTSPLIATGLINPITGTSPVRTGVTGPTSPIIATAPINPITGTSHVPSGATGPSSLRGRPNRSAARPRKSGGALSPRHRAPSRAARLRPRAVSPGPTPRVSRRKSSLKPGGDSGTYFQHYPLEVSRFDPESSSVRITARTPGIWRAGQEVLLVEGQPPAGAPAAPAVVITGSADAGGALDSAAVTGKVVFLAYGPGLNAIAPKVLALRPLAVMLVAAFPDSIWAKLPGHAASVSVRNPNSESGPAIPAVFVVRTATAGGLLAQGGATADSLRAWGDRPLAAHPLMDVTLQLDVRQRVLQHASAPNSIGILEGSDPVLKKEYVLFTAHMDHIGTQ